jgi:hypothetical protein
MIDGVHEINLTVTEANKSFIEVCAAAINPFYFFRIDNTFKKTIQPFDVISAKVEVKNDIIQNIIQIYA